MIPTVQRDCCHKSFFAFLSSFLFWNCHWFLKEPTGKAEHSQTEKNVFKDSFKFNLITIDLVLECPCESPNVGRDAYIS